MSRQRSLSKIGNIPTQSLSQKDYSPFSYREIKDGGFT